ncbi:hypothetical protein WA158_004923 [Blastocystis sp. Blastoise]
MSAIHSSLWSEDFKCSHIPEECHNNDVIVGIDEAGRGPVLGPMVYGCAYWVLDKNDEISKKGFDDSKALTAEKREELKTIIDSSMDIGYVLRVLSPEEISANMLQKNPYNLNFMSHNAAIGLIQTLLDNHVQVKEVYVDTVGDPKKYQDKLLNHFSNTHIKFTVSKKADALYKCVSAASIVAKVCRDNLIQEIYDNKSIIRNSDSLGSGYPSDPNTKKWLTDNIHTIFGFPRIVRFSWSTITELFKKPTITSIKWEEDEEDGHYISESMKKNQTHKKIHIHYFERRGIHSNIKF